jgi:hypothetical protein
MVCTAKFADESTFLLSCFRLVKRGVIFVIGDFIQELDVAVLVSSLRFFLGAPAFVIAPDLLAFFCLLPHVIKPDNPGFFDA